MRNNMTGKTMKTRTALVATVLLSALHSQAALILTNGDFDNDADLGAAADNATAPSSWNWNGASWDTFRYGADGNGGWTDNAMNFGTAWATPDVGYLYQAVGTYASEQSVTLSGTAFNRLGGYTAGDIDVAFYYTTPASFTATDGTDIAGTGTLIGSVLDVDINALTSVDTAGSQAFSHTVNFAGSGISVGDTVWVRLGDGLDTYSYDEAIVDDLSVTSVIPEPATLGLISASALGLLFVRRNFLI